MPDPITKKVRDSLKRVKVRKKIVRDSTSRMEMVNVLKKELGKENYNKIRTNKVKDVKNIVDIENYDMRVRLSEENEVSKDELKKLLDIQVSNKKLLEKIESEWLKLTDELDQLQTE